ncbi:ferredoxin family protein [Novosphingobium profundi]|uniref:ferredoxin family protein n=1 Tax=Novosphingobium profundi TaxID=1774954 RepID=UPI0031B9DE3C
MNPTVNVENKLFFNRYVVDAGRPHITVKPHATPSAQLRALVYMCPAGCYGETEAATIEIIPDGCLECGTCRIVTAGTGEVEWHYPRGGFGILYKFG